MAARRRPRFADLETAVTPDLINAVCSVSRPLRSAADLDPLIKRLARARYVLLGEASHGTHEYYSCRDAISRRLVQQGFSFIAVEGDWPDCYRINRYVRGYPDSGASAREVLGRFERWPTWMWANEEVLEFMEWLRRYNEQLPNREQVGFYGLDVYSLWDSLYQVMSYLGTHIPSAVPAARKAFHCFELYGEHAHGYARATHWLDDSCEGAVVGLLAEIRRGFRAHPGDGPEAEFNAEQNALVVKNADHYYRTMVQGGPDSWNLRDRHMVETLERLMRRQGPGARAVVWGHNTHIGDARFTDMASEGMVNVGQLVREGHAEDDVMLVGFGSYEGSVIAAREWQAPMERMEMPPARPGSWEQVLHEAGLGNCLLLLEEAVRYRDIRDTRGHRAICVVYKPAVEQFGNYVPTVLPRRYDAFLYLEKTQALRPLHEVQVNEHKEVPETFPSGV
jgi:erythromycin esterase-like protein